MLTEGRSGSDFMVDVINMARFALVVAGLGCGAMLYAQGTKAKTNAKPVAAKAAETPAGNAENGRRLFAKDGCYQCHGLEAQGSLLSGPRLGPDPIPYEALVMYVRKPTA